MKMLTTLLLILAAAPSWATSNPVPTGYFTGKATASDDTTSAIQIWLKSVTQAKSTTTYGLVKFKNLPWASLFKVERLPDGTMTWTEFFESDKNVLTQPPTSEATYMGDSFQVDRRHVRLTLIATDFGKKVGCLHNLEVVTDRGIDWADFPAIARHYDDGSAKEELDVSGTVLSGTFILKGERMTGNYRLTPIFPGLATLRAKIVSPDSNDGRAEERKISAMVVALKRHRAILSNKDDLTFIKLNPLDTQNTCWSPETGVED